MTELQAEPSPTPKPIHPPVNLFKGFLLAAAGLLLFSCMDSTTKYLTTHYNVPTVVAMRYIVHCALMLVILAPRHSATLINTQRTGLTVLRAVVLTMASLFIGLALQRMPLAETTAINFLAPTLIALFASSVLGEQIGGFGWAAVIVGFIGVLLIARPGSGLDVWGVVFALGAAAANAAYQVLSRMLASTERAITLLFYTALVGTIVFGLALPFFWENKTPSTTEVILFISMGTFGGLGHYFFTLAYRHAPASVLAPMTYLQLLWAGLLGWVIFDTVPDGLGILGMAIIAASGLLIAIKTQLAKRR
ncbi:MAG TPA: DMT family transporter [Cellvibrio sp.]|nr:DMT family transporter [Cellvibrio sp.]